MRRRRLVAMGVLVAGLAGCGGGGPSGPSVVDLPNGGTSADLTFCVNETNRYRARVGKPALSESSSVEAFAAAAAQADALSGVPHGYYRSHDPGFGAENEALNWSLAIYGSVHNAIAQAIAAFWSEGPGGGHYENMVGPYTQLGCGLFVSGQLITLVQDYR
jgi:uncharacterized protein YkwD